MIEVKSKLPSEIGKQEKEKYEESMAELKTLLDKRNEKQHEEIIEKFIKSK